jgi:hypothetical protein
VTTVTGPFLAICYGFLLGGDPMPMVIGILVFLLSFYLILWAILGNQWTPSAEP